MTTKTRQEIENRFASAMAEYIWHFIARLRDGARDHDHEYEPPKDTDDDE